MPIVAASSCAASSSRCSRGFSRTRILVLFEALEPLVEALGFAIVAALFIENSVNWTYLVAFFLVALLTGEVLSATALLVEEIGFRRYSAKDLARLTAWGFVEALWFRPALNGGA